MIRKLFVILFASVLLVACGNNEQNEANEENTEVENIIEVENNPSDVEEEIEEPEEEPENVEEEPEEVVEQENEPEKDDIPREYRNALSAAQNYLDLMPFSEKGLFEQLTSEYGDQYPEDAAQYAIENVEVDYNEEALEAAVSYQELMPMSDQE